jgi:cell division protein FtsW
MGPRELELQKISRLLVLNLIIILAIGIIMVYSASYLFAKENFGSSTFFVSNQLIFLMMGLVLAFVVSQTKIQFWLKFGPYIHYFFTLILILTLVPKIGLSVKGAKRWIHFFHMTLQPGEMIKYTLIFCSLPFFEDFEQYSIKEKIGHAIPIFFPLAILIKQPDFGSFFVGFMVILFVCYMSSFPRKYFYGLFAVGGVAIIGALFLKSYRIARLLTFLDPWKNPKTSGFQIIQSYLGFANGGIFGQGLGNSNEKLFYLPEAHNDFILSVIGEELGFVGVFVIVTLFLFLVYLGFKLAMKLKSKWPMILVSSIIFVIGIQAVLNMAVVLGLLPTKGLNLPLISYGGSSLISNFFAIGLIFSAVKDSLKTEENKYY